MEVCVLASGSKGNCIYVSGGGVSLLVDAGLSAREMVTRMQAACAPVQTDRLLVGRFMVFNRDWPGREVLSARPLVQRSRRRRLR